jgi:hypothetical protein
MRRRFLIQKNWFSSEILSQQHQQDTQNLDNHAKISIFHKIEKHYSVQQAHFSWNQWLQICIKGALLVHENIVFYILLISYSNVSALCSLLRSQPQLLGYFCSSKSDIFFSDPISICAFSALSVLNDNRLWYYFDFRCF